MYRAYHANHTTTTVECVSARYNYVTHMGFPLVIIYGVVYGKPLLPARRYASACLCESNVSVRPSIVCLSIRLSHAGIVSK